MLCVLILSLFRSAVHRDVARYATRFKAVQEGREVELKRQKDILAAAEKMRREKWLKDQTRKIKEMTIKGLEPEILRMVQDHEAQLVRVRCVSATD